MHFILKVICNIQHKFNKALTFRGVQATASRVDLMIVDILEYLPIPMVSSLPTSIPDWNSKDKNFLAMVFEFGSSFVHDNGILLLFHKNDLKLRVDIRGFARAYHFKILKEWIGINSLSITDYLFP